MVNSKSSGIIQVYKKTKTQTKQKNMYAFLFFKSSRIFVQNGYVPKKNNVLPGGEGAGNALLVKMLLQTLRIL